MMNAINPIAIKGPQYLIMHIITNIRKFLRIPSEHKVTQEVRKHFKKNFIVNTLDAVIWLMGESFVSVETILPVFASTLTNSAVIIGLVPALMHAGWFIPQFFMAGIVKKLDQKLPFTKTLAKLERIPYIILPLLAYGLNWLSEDVVIWIFIFIIAWRGFVSGMVALPWQEIIAKVIPSPVRSRFFGVSRMLGMGMGLIGSVLSGIILAELSYPNNFALSFLIGATLIWISYFFFIRTVEPETRPQTHLRKEPTSKNSPIDFKSYQLILRHDKNFRRYLTSRSMFQFGNMATGFLAVYGINHFALADQQAALFSGLIFASSILGFIVWSIWGDHLGPRKILIISNVLQTMMLVIGAFASNVWVFYLAFLLLGFAQSGSVIGEMILGMELGTEEDRPIYIGLARSIPGIFTLFAPIIGGVFIECVGYPFMFLIAFIFYCASIGLLYYVHEKQPLAQV